MEDLVKEHRLVSFKLNEAQICKRVEPENVNKDVLENLMNSLLES